MRNKIILIEKISRLLLNGRFLLIINGLSVHRFSSVKSIKINPRDEIAIMPVVFGGCKQMLVTQIPSDKNCNNKNIFSNLHF